MTVRLIITAAIAVCITGAAQAQEARPPQEASVPRQIEISPEIAPAVVPYMMCLDTAMGEVAEASNGLNEAEYTAAVPVVREKCAVVRRTALDRGVQLLNQSKLGDAKDRPGRVEAALAGIEDAMLNVTFPPEPGAN